MLLGDGAATVLCTLCLAVKYRRERVYRVAGGLYDEVDVMERQDWHSYETETRYAARLPWGQS